MLWLCLWLWLRLRFVVVVLVVVMVAVCGWCVQCYDGHGQQAGIGFVVDTFVLYRFALGILNFGL